MEIKFNHFLSLIFVLSIFILLSCNREISLYVSPYGNDTYPGTKGKPLKTMDGAKLAVRNVIKEKPGIPVTIYFSDGDYLFEQPVKFTLEDSGSEKSPIVYKAIKGGTPIFSGSKTIRKWKLLGNDQIGTRLKPSIREKVYVVDLKEEGVANFGDPTDEGKRPELVCNGELQQLARWPDEGFIKSGMVKGKTLLPPNYTKNRGTKEGIFEYMDTYQNKWIDEPDIRLSGYWYWDWCEEFQKVEQWDSISRTVNIKEPYHVYGYKDSLRYFGLNLLCELDQPGEWYLDRSTGKLYWYVPENVDLQTANITLTYFSNPYMLEMEDCSYVILEGLTFMESRGSGVLIRNGKNNLLLGCRFLRFGKDGIHIQEGTGHGVSGCYLSTFGYGGMRIQGGDRKTLTSSDHFVEHTVIEYFSLFKRTYQPAIHLTGCGIRVANNRISHCPSSAMRLEGNDFIIEYNEFNHVVNESDDQGGIDIHNNPTYRGNIIRYNRWSDIQGGTLHGAAGIRLDDMISGVLIYGNLFERCGALHFGGVQIHGGKDNIIDNNVFYQCPYAVSFTLWSMERWLGLLDAPHIQAKLYSEVDINSSIYQEKYPEMRYLRENTGVNTVTNNLIIDCDEKFLRINDKQILSNNNIVNSERKSLSEFCTKEVLMKYGLQPIPFDSIGPKKIPWL